MARPVGGGGQLGGTNTQSAHALWLVFFALITGTMLSDFHLIGTLTAPPLCFTHIPAVTVAQYDVLLHLLLMFLIPLNVLNQLYERAVKMYMFTVEVFCAL